MTYKDVLDDLFDIISRHKMIQTVGYGPLSDIKVPKDGAETNYPYAFIRPTNYTIGKNQMTYRFDLIMMEMCNDTDEEIIKAQSDCHQYLKDILAELYYNMEKYDFSLNNSITVFQEKYDDVVSGATLQLELVVRDALDDCIAPFVNYTLEYEVSNEILGLRDYNSASYGTRSIMDLWDIPEAPATYKIEYDITFQVVDPITVSNPVVKLLQDNDNPRFIDEVKFDGRNTTTTQRITRSIVIELQDVAPDNNDLGLMFGEGIQPYFDDAINLLYSNVKIYRVD